MEQVPELAICLSHPFVFSVRHDVKQSADRWTGSRDGSVLKVVASYLALCFNDRVHTGDKNFQILSFRTQKLLRKHRAGNFKDAPQKAIDERSRDPIPQAAGEHGSPLIFEIIQLFEITVLDEKLRLTLPNAHAAPQLRN